MLKTPKGNQEGLKKLPKDVRNKMGYMNKGGIPKGKSKNGIAVIIMAGASNPPTQKKKKKK